MKIYDMTDEVWHDFIKEGCEPHCHSCGCKIEVEGQFALRTALEKVDEFNRRTSKVEVMVCRPCASRALPQREIDRAHVLLSQAWIERPKAQAETQSLRSGCMIVDGKVVPGMAE